MAMALSYYLCRFSRSGVSPSSYLSLLTTIFLTLLPCCTVRRRGRLWGGTNRRSIGNEESLVWLLLQVRPMNL